MTTFLDRGAFADVFDLHDGTVLKVYRRIAQTHASVRNWDDHEFLIRCLCFVEAAAYNKLQGMAVLERYIPKFFGRFEPAEFNLAAPTAEPFVPGCALRLERIRGQDVKIAHVMSPLREEIETVLEAIHDQVGRINVWNCSCFVPGPRSRFVVIDFALWDDWHSAQAHLEEHGGIAPDVRRRIGPE